MIIFYLMLTVAPLESSQDLFVQISIFTQSTIIIINGVAGIKFFIDFCFSQHETSSQRQPSTLHHLSQCLCLYMVEIHILSRNRTLTTLHSMHCLRGWGYSKMYCARSQHAKCQQRTTANQSVTTTTTSTHCGIFHHITFKLGFIFLSIEQ